MLSESASGIQHCLNKLHTYCSKWNLTINTSKTKVLIFNKGGHLYKKYKFTYGSNLIDITQKYCYLGIIFTCSGTFNEAIQCQTFSQII